MVNLYQFLVDVGGYPEGSFEGGEVSAETISQLAKEKNCPTCKETLKWFCSLYGAEAGNLALKVFAVGGVYIGGGIAPKILEEMQSGVFMEAFMQKEGMSEVLKEVPVRIILDFNSALRGSFHYLCKK
jgi:glucokinase